MGIRPQVHIRCREVVLSPVTKGPERRETTASTIELQWKKTKGRQVPRSPYLRRGTDERQSLAPARECASVR